MVNLVLLGIYTLFFLFLTWRRFEWGIFLLFLLLPTYLIRFQVGPLPSTLLEVMLLSICGVFFCKQRKLFLPFFKKFFQENRLLSIGIFLFLVGATIGIFASVDVRKALGEWRAFYLEPIALFFVISMYVKNFREEERMKKITQYILFPLILCGLATSILAIYQHFTGWLVPNAFWANRNTYRVTGWYGFPNAVGLFLAPLVPLAIFLLQKTWKKKNEFVEKIMVMVSALFLAIVPFALLFAKGSGPILGTAAGLGILFLYYKKTRLPAILLGIMSVIIVCTAPPLYTLKQELLAQDYSGSLRRDIWRETISLLKDRPVLGTGLASYEERIVPYRHNHWIEVFHHPHNIFLTMWVNTGLVGLIGFLLVIIWFFTETLRNKKREAKFLLASLVTFLVMGLVDSPYIKNDLAILFWFLPTLLIFNRPLLRFE